MAKMSKQRMGEIALAMLKSKFEREGLRNFGPELRRDLGNLAKDTGIPIAELEEFSKEILVWVLMKTYRVKHVSLTMNNDPPSK